ncbi:MAG TPA: tetratricopeptide repeat protein [Rariglobus sp.]|jgi:tetratricopeptide (TPR) repeat protein|nr:tetratricopeptide repeat protein [Rariglobus sp.]
MSRRLSFILSFALIHAISFGVARSQTFYFNDGRKASMPEARVQGNNIIVPLKLAGTDGGSAEITLSISSLNHIEWPTPPVIAEAEADLKAGKPADALKKIDAILTEQEPFREIPGSWWNQGAVVKAVALARLGKTVDADVMLERMRRSKAPSDDVSRGEMAIVTQLMSAGKIDAAKIRMEKIEATATDDASLAAIAVTKGKILEKAGQAEDALLSYLRVPVFYPTEEEQMPAALLGAARAYKQLGDYARATSTIETLTTRFPKSPEAAQAKG